MKIDLTEDNFIIFAAKHYDNIGCTGIKEFEADLKRFKYLKRLFNRYHRTQKISERLVLNHIISLRNVFMEALLPLLFFRIEKKHWSTLKTFLVFLNYLPDNYYIGEIPESDIPLDGNLITILRKI